MCELYGYSGKNKRIINDELSEFFAHSDTNPDGWGLAVFSGPGQNIEKEPLPAAKSRRLKDLLESPIETAAALAHIRWATIGYDEYHNTHPFWDCDQSGRLWTMIHNGTIFEAEVLSPYSRSQQGTTDSERIFLYLMDLLNEGIKEKGRALTEEERFEILNRMVIKLAPENKLNLIIFDGEVIYVHSNFRESLHLRKEAGGITFSSRPLQEGNWEEVPFNRLVSYREGEECLRGDRHEGEYFPDEQRIRELFLAYSCL